MTKKKIGQRLRAWRIEQDWYGYKLAKVINISQGTLSEMETGKSYTSTPTIIKIMTKTRQTSTRGVTLIPLIKSSSSSSTCIKDLSVALHDGHLDGPRLFGGVHDVHHLPDPVFVIRCDNNHSIPAPGQGRPNIVKQFRKCAGTPIDRQLTLLG